ncbi:MAG: lytic murein transglycosylase [Pseudomonadota bacterium]
MSRLWIIAIAVGLLATQSMAEAVDRSVRPQARPDAQVVQVVAQSQVLAATLPTITRLRPQIRPDGLDTDALPVAANPPEFDRWVRGFRGRALAQGINPQVFDRAFRNARYEPEVISKDRNQAEFKSQIWDYLDNAVAPPRINEGQAALRKHRRLLDRIEAAYGVEAEVVVAVWGLESRYGTRMGDYPMIDAMATLAFDGRRGKFFESQLIAALKILQSGDVNVGKFTGSWAGAMGHTQFIPTSYLAYAVDFTGDGKRDIWTKNKPDDALASTAAYLKRFGWRKGQPWGVEVRLPRGFNAANAKRSIKRTPSQWAQLGVTDMRGKPVPDYGQASILLPAGTQGAAFMIFNNFAVIEKYNKADAYVIGVGHLSDRITGGPAIQTAWPRGYEPLTFEQKKELQRRLKRKGFAIEKIDGLIGPNSRSAIRAYQQSVGMSPDGYASQDVLRRIKQR